MSKPTAFPLDESRLPFEIPRDEPYREKIARLGQMITDRIPAKKGILTKDGSPILFTANRSRATIILYVIKLWSSP